MCMEKQQEEFNFSEDEIETVYEYLSIYYDDLSEEQQNAWDIVLKMIDPNYVDYSQEKINNNEE